jgi:hypothetical protein
MLAEFRRQLFQLPLISTTWTSIEDRYRQEKHNCLLPIRFILTIIEQTVTLIQHSIIRPTVEPYYHYCK